MAALRHDRCTSDSCRFAAMPKSAARLSHRKRRFRGFVASTDKSLHAPFPGKSVVGIDVVSADLPRGRSCNGRGGGGNQLKRTERSLLIITCCPPAPGGHPATGRRSLVITPAFKNLFGDQPGATAKFRQCQWQLPY